MSQAETVDEPLDSNFVERIRSLERQALEQLFARNFERAYDLSYALTGDPQQAETVVERAFLRVLDGVSAYGGSGRGMDGWILQLATRDAARAPSQAAGVRTALARLDPAVYETLALRLLGGLPSDLIAAGSGRGLQQVQAALAAGLRRLAGSADAGGLDEIDQAVQNLLRGEEPASAGAGFKNPSDLVPVLNAAASVRGLPYEPADPATRTRVRTTFLTSAEERRARRVQSTQHQPLVPGVDLEARHRESRGALAALGFALLLAFGVGIVLALLSSFADPDSPFYPLKRMGESALLTLTSDPLSRADLEVKLAETRAREAETMAADSHNADLAVTAIGDHYDLLRAAAADLITSRQRASDRRWTQVRDSLENQASLQVTPLERELEQVGAKPQADQIRDENERFQADRKNFDPKLGKPLPNPNASPNPNPSAPPTQ